MQEKTQLKIDWATHEAAKYACENWHYSKRIPVNKLVKIGVWENKKFIGVIIFGLGASATLYKQFNIERNEVCELVRVALNEHKTEVSRIISIAIKFLKKSNPKLKVVVSFADPSEGHHGGIYQAGNWIYTGKSNNTKEYYFNNKWRHATDVYKRLNKDQIRKLKTRKKEGKHRYIIAFEDNIKKEILKKALPYPKRASSVESGTSEFHSEGGSESLTDALQLKK